jgi:hypothetical protein
LKSFVKYEKGEKLNTLLNTVNRLLVTEKEERGKKSCHSRYGPSRQQLCFF